MLGKEWTLADTAVAPFLVRFNRAKLTGIGLFGEDTGKQLIKELEDPKFAKFNAYAKAVTERDSVKNTFPTVSVLRRSF